MDREFAMLSKYSEYRLFSVATHPQRLRATLDPRLDRLELPKHPGELGRRRDPPHVLDRRRRRPPRLGVPQEPAREEQQGRDLQVRQRQLPADQVLLAALDRGLDLADGALERRRLLAVPRLVEGREPRHVHQRRGVVGEQLRVGEQRPLGDLGAGLEVRAQELGRQGARGGEVGGDGGALGQGEAVGALEGRDLAQRELGQELGRLVVLAEFEVTWDVELQAVERGDDLGLSGGLVRSAQHIAPFGALEHLSRQEKLSRAYTLDPRVVGPGVDGAEGSHYGVLSW